MRGWLGAGAVVALCVVVAFCVVWTGDVPSAFVACVGMYCTGMTIGAIQARRVR
jgi:hypothetical protein